MIHVRRTTTNEPGLFGKKKLKVINSPINGCIYFLCVETSEKLCLWSITVSGRQVKDRGRETKKERKSLRGEREGGWEGGGGGEGGEGGMSDEGESNYYDVCHRWWGECIGRGHLRRAWNHKEKTPPILSQGNGEVPCTWTPWKSCWMLVVV